jgi:3-hydroxybutyryl-CoA dehydrogenase
MEPKNMDVKIAKAAVVGSGVMGHGVCQLLAQKGIQVNLVDISQEFLDRAKGWITDNLEYMADLGELDKSQVAEVLSRISFSTDLAASLPGAGHVLEAVSEDMEIKQKVWQVLSDHADPEAILASNTSSYDINELAKGVKNPERVLGTHWFHPPPITPCVEVIPGEKTSQAAIDWTMEFFIWLGKVPTLCKSAPGFVANRIQLAMAKEALALVEEGLATPAEVDRVVKTSFGFRLGAYGPFEIMDQAGADTYNAYSNTCTISWARSTSSPANCFLSRWKRAGWA